MTVTHNETLLDYLQLAPPKRSEENLVHMYADVTETIIFYIIR